MSAPTIPPRPSRAQAGPTAVKQDIPQIPPRPVRKTDPSPNRAEYARSPLNFLPAANGYGRPPPPSGHAGEGDAPRRPPSVALPSEVGQEGIEYTSYDQLPAEAHGASGAAAANSEQTRNVAADLPMHQPKASVPQSAAKSRIETVTRTDSSQAAAAGIGKARPEDDVHKDAGAPLSRVTSRTYDDHPRRVPSAEPHPLRAQESFNRSTSSLHNGTPRPASIHTESEYRDGIPEIGQQIPLYPNAGDVQAPSPAPTQSQFSSGIGFFNDGSARAHHRKRSSRQEFGPPGSYGLHGHGNESRDQFEQAWVAKHPDEAMKEGYNPYMLRPETALSTEQLNRIVSQSDDIGMGTSPSAVGTPSQDIAFDATEQFTSRNNSPRPSPAALPELKKRPSSVSEHQPDIQSPLRKASFFQEAAQRRGDGALESEDDDVIHVNPPNRRGSKVTGGGAMDNTIDLGPTGGNTEELGGWYDERGEGTPILASDETIKRPSSAFLQPAVSPEDVRAADDAYYDSDDMPASRRNSWKPPSRPSSRPGSGYQGGPLHRFISHEEHHGSGMGTPLEEIEEYEPLFPEDEKEHQKPKLYKRRPGLEQHHFPSQDIWEDTPHSLQYQTTVQTPEPPRAQKVPQTDANPSKVFETPEQEQARRTNNQHDMTSDSKTFAKPHFKPGVMDDVHAERPGVQRFPSQDIWEDTPDSMRLVTTVSSPQMDETRSPPEDRPTTAALPLRQDEEDARSTTGMTQLMRPGIPARPERKSKLAQEIRPEKEDQREREVPDLGTNEQQMPDRTKPTIPDRPKPSVPARPARPSHSDQAEGAPLSKTASATSGTSGASDETVTSPPAPKAKPAVPARPAGSKIAALQSTFMSDLNNRLKLGPQGPPPKAKEPEPESEAAKEPLEDARKSRARGPARRKPAASAAAAAAPSDDSAFSFSTPMMLWQIDEREELSVASADDTNTAALEKVMSENEAKNTEMPAMLVKSESMSSDAQRAHVKEAIGAEGDAPPPSIEPAIAEEQKAVQPELESALAEAEPAPSSAAEEQQKEIREMASASVQTGQKDLSMTSGDGEVQHKTAFVGGRAQPLDGDDTVVQDGE